MDPTAEEELDANREWRKTTLNADERQNPVKDIYSLSIASFNL